MSTEHAAAVAGAVSAVLDSAVTGLPVEVAEIVRLRSAAARIIESELDHRDEDRLLRALGRQAARATLPLWALEAILGEIRHEDPPDPPLNRERAARRLRSAGYESCPTCRVPLLDEQTIDRAERRARRAAEDREVHRATRRPS